MFGEELLDVKHLDDEVGRDNERLDGTDLLDGIWEENSAVRKRSYHLTAVSFRG